MSFRLPDKWVWDFWLVRRGGEHHLFYLQAPRALGNPALRHHNATIGHAVSADYRELACAPRRPPARRERQLGRPCNLDGEHHWARGPLVHVVYRRK